MEDMNLRHIIKEALTKTDENKIGVMIRKEIKDAFGKDLEKKVTDIVDKAEETRNEINALTSKMDELLDIANKNKISIIEDNAESPGGLYKGKKLGNFGDLSCFSFFANPRKLFEFCYFHYRKANN